MSTLTAATLAVPGARLHYEVRGSGPLVALVGAPMHAESFAPVADLLATDHTVLTTDPRGVHRSPLDVPEAGSTPQERADDLARLLAHVDAGPAAVLGSSGGAVTVLALAGSRPELVHTVIAHEPPLHCLVADRADRDAALEQMVATYASGDPVGAWELFLADADIALPDGVSAAVFAAEPGSPQEADERHWFLHEIRATCYWEPDLAALREGPARVVVGIGTDSAGELCDRTSRALATALGTEPVLFPGGHIGFADDPVAFVPRLREVLGS
jgi:pimeloyl-ACP methyl ester carboxylesterase